MDPLQRVGQSKFLMAPGGPRLSAPAEALPSVFDSVALARPGTSTPANPPLDLVASGSSMATRALGGGFFGGTHAAVVDAVERITRLETQGVKFQQRRRLLFWNLSLRHPLEVQAHDRARRRGSRPRARRPAPRAGRCRPCGVREAPGPRRSRGEGRGATLSALLAKVSTSLVVTRDLDRALAHLLVVESTQKGKIERGNDGSLVIGGVKIGRRDGTEGAPLTE